MAACQKMYWGCVDVSYLNRKEKSGSRSVPSPYLFVSILFILLFLLRKLMNEASNAKKIPSTVSGAEQAMTRC